MHSNEILEDSQANSSILKFALESYGVLDPEGTHHEFASGVHGQKLDFDKIVSGSTLYNLWVDVTAMEIRRLHEKPPDMLVGVANGANRLANSVAGVLRENYWDNVQGLETEKISPNGVALSNLARLAIRNSQPQLVLVLDDVGTTGGTVATAVRAIQNEGVDRVEALVTWQRRPSLPKLFELEIFYSSIIYEPLPSFSPEDCQNLPEGFCHKGSQLIAHSK